MSRKVILDVDPGIDDAIAIVTALKSDEIEVAGIATVYGNVSPQVGMLNIKSVEIAGPDGYSCYTGSEKTA